MKSRLLCLYFTAAFTTMFLAGKYIISRDAASDSVPRPLSRKLQQFASFDPLASLLNVKDQQQQSLMHMMSGRRGADDITESLASLPAGLDMAEAVLLEAQQTSQDSGNAVVNPDQARLHSLSRSQALAKSRSHQHSANPVTAYTPPPVGPQQSPDRSLNSTAASSKPGDIAINGAVPEGSQDCTETLSQDAIMLCLVEELASLNTEVQALAAKVPFSQASMRPAACFGVLRHPSVCWLPFMLRAQLSCQSRCGLCR